jgi:hypothetical protein
MAETVVAGVPLDWAAELARIRARNEKRWGTDRFEVAARVGNELHTGKADLVGELIQNAEDAGAQEVGFEFLPSGLLIWNDGHPFKPSELEDICALWDSHKSFAEAGYFGIGFKVVLSVCTEPHIYSGALACKLVGGLDPESIEAPVYPALKERVTAGKTCVWLPWRPSLDADLLYQEARRQLEEAASDSLAFMQRLERIEFRRGTDVLWYGASRSTNDAMFHATTVLDGTTGQSREWLVYNERATIPKAVMDALVQRAAEQSTRTADRLRSEDNPSVPLQVAFSVSEGRLTTTTGRIFARIPTKEKTGLPFHVNSRFPTNLARDHIRWDDPLAVWLVEAFQSAAKKAAYGLVQRNFRGSRLILCMPAKAGLRPQMQVIATAYRERLLGQSLLLDSNGEPAEVGSIRVAHNQLLYQLMPDPEVGEVTGQSTDHWPAADLREAPYVEVLRDIGCPSLEAPAAIDHLTQLTRIETKGKGSEWSWLRGLYAYLDDVGQKALKALAEKALVPVRNGSTVTIANAIFPPDAAHPPPPELVDFIESLPLVPNELARDEATSGILRKHKASPFEARLVFRALFDLSDLSAGGSPEKHLGNVKVLYQSWQRQAIDRKVLAELGVKMLLVAADGSIHLASELYIPASLGGSPNVETYFALAGGRGFLSPGYKFLVEEPLAESPALRDFFEALSCPRLPCITQTITEGYTQAMQRANAARIPTANLGGGQEWKFLDWHIDGIAEACQAAATDADKRLAVWKVIAELNATYGRDGVRPINGMTVSLSRIQWVVVRNRVRQAYQVDGTPLWVLTAQSIAWLPALSGQPYKATDLTAESEAGILGPNLEYLPTSWMERAPEKALAETLGVRMRADRDGTLSYLRQLAKAPPNHESWGPVIIHLAKLAKDDDPSTQLIRAALATEALVPCIDGLWRKSSAACWHDELGVVPSVWPKAEFNPLRTFLVERLAMSSGPSLQQYVVALQDMAQKGHLLPTKAAKKLYQTIWTLSDGGEHQTFTALVSTRAWVAKNASGLLYAYPRDVAVDDHTHRASLFRGLANEWPLDGLLEMARTAGMASMKDAVPAVLQRTGTTRDETASQKLAALWPYITAFTKDVSRPPAVFSCNDLLVTYELTIGGRTVKSLPDPTCRSIHTSEGILVDASAAPIELPDLVGDALEAKMGPESRVREFTKDIWDLPADLLALKIKAWERRLGRDLQAAAPVPEEPVPEVILTEKPQMENEPAVNGGRPTAGPRGIAAGGSRPPSSPPTGEPGSAPVATASFHVDSHWAAGIAVEDLEPNVVPYEAPTRGPRQPLPVVRVPAPGETLESLGIRLGSVPAMAPAPESRLTAEARRAVGRWGESYVVTALRKKYEAELGVPAVPTAEGYELKTNARTVVIQWHNKEVERGIGHDILVTDNGVKRHYEVKTTIAAYGTQLTMTATEWDLACETRAAYTLARVSHAGTGDAEVRYIDDPVALCIGVDPAFRRISPTIEP